MLTVLYTAEREKQQVKGAFFMRKMICVMLMAVFIGWPGSAFASDFNINISVSRQEDGTACGELWYNNQVVWRLEFLCDGARPALGGRSVNTTTLIPDIVDGMFILKVK